MPNIDERLFEAEPRRTATALKWVTMLILAGAIVFGIVLYFIPGQRDSLLADILRLINPSSGTNQEARPILQKLSRSFDADLVPASKSLLNTFCNKPVVDILTEKLRENHDYAAAVVIGEEFLDKCDKSPGVGFYTAQSYYRLTKYQKALATLDRFEEPRISAPDFVSWRGFVLEKLGRHEDAAAEFEKSIYLFGDKARISGSQFHHITRALTAAGKYCEAIRPMEWYVSFDPFRLDQTVTEIIDNLDKRGNCSPQKVGSSTVRLHGSQGGTFIVQAKVNDVEGRFIFDTGAFSVHLSKQFAEKAKIPVSNERKITIVGVTGARKDYLSRATSVTVGEQTARNVRVTVASVDKGFMGRTDGLLGQTFLSRFKIEVDGTRLKIKSRK